MTSAQIFGKGSTPYIKDHTTIFINLSNFNWSFTDVDRYSNSDVQW